MESEEAIERFAALASPARLAIFRRLMLAGPEGIRSGDVARAIGAPPNTASTNLGQLERVGLVTRRRTGRSINYAIDFDGVAALLAYLVEDCCFGRVEVCAPLAELAARSACRPVSAT